MYALKNRLHLNGEKWIFLGAYKPPSISDESFETDCTLGLDRISEKYEHYILLDDLNFDMLDKSKSSNLNNVCDIFDLSNTVNEPTCFTSGINPLLLMLFKHAVVNVLEKALILIVG